jgi:hypothetical protein
MIFNIPAENPTHSCVALLREVMLRGGSSSPFMTHIANAVKFDGHRLLPSGLFCILDNKRRFLREFWTLLVARGDIPISKPGHLFHSLHQIL